MSRTVGTRVAAYTEARMEWVLQVVDEIDDAIGAVRHGWDGVHAETGVLWGGGIAAALTVALIIARLRFL